MTKKNILYLTWWKLFVKNNLAIILFGTGMVIISYLPYLLIQKPQSLLIISTFNGLEYQSYSEIFSTWHKANLGSFTVLATPYFLIAEIVIKLVGEYVGNILMMGTPKLLAGIFAYILLGKFSKNTAIRIVGALFYSLSIYGQAITENTLPGGYLFYTALPLIFYLFLDISKTNLAKKGLFLALGLSFIIDTNLTYIVYLYLLLGIYSIYAWIFLQDKSRIVYFIFFGIVFILLSQVYYLPLFAYSYIYKTNLVSKSLAAETVGWKSGSSQISEILRLMGSIDFYNTETIHNALVYSRPFFLYFIKNPLIFVISFLFPIIAIVGLVMTTMQKKIKQSTAPFFLITFLFFIFFSVGINPSNPLIQIYQFLSQKIFFFAIFRDPYKSVSIINLIYTVGIVYFFIRIKTLKRFFSLSVVFFLSLLFIFSLPYVLGSVYSISELIRVPSYVNDFAKWTQSSKDIHDSKKLLLPSQAFPVLSLTKQEAKGSPLYFQTLDSTSVQNAVTFTPFIHRIQDTVFSTQFSRIIGFYNIPFVIDLHDINAHLKLYPTISPEIISKELRKSTQHIKTFGNNSIEVYATNKDFLNDTIYIPKKVIAVSETSPLDNIFASQQSNEFAFLYHKAMIQPSHVPTIRIISRDKYKYTIQINHLDQDSLMVFNEHYAPSWLMKKSNTLFGIIPLRHILVNGIGNGYILNKDIIKKQLRPSDYSINTDGSINTTLVLYFQPQLYFYIGLTITCVTLLVSLGFFLYPSIRKR